MPLLGFAHLFLLGCESGAGVFDEDCIVGGPVGQVTMSAMYMDLIIDEDADDDGMTDRYENGHACLDAEVDDAGSDPDVDLIASGGEHAVGAFPCITDSDGDRCADGEETGSNHSLGGQRSPGNRWDFYDVNGTSKVDAVDIALVRSKFNGSGPTPPADLAYDRRAGAQPWAPNEPDHVINAVDIGIVRASFNDSCQAAP
jgi:hypothetical protein